ncbi:MAG: FtsX-like permease family protein, partial [Methanosphaera sp.]|nr:FtsX-like permease family protein [Methanosphaera sp.]
IIVSRGDILTHNYGNLYYFVSNYDKELVIKKTKAMLNKMGYSVNVYTLEEQLNESLKDEFELIKTYVIVLIFLSSIGVVTLSSISINSVIDEMKNIGIMYSIGFTYKDMRNITISENVLKILVGSVVGFAISYSYIYLNSLFYEKDIINEIEFSTMPLIILVIMIVITMLSVVIPLRYIKKINIRELVTK